MEISFDPAKNIANIAKHGIALADFAGFDADPVVRADVRFDYGETRFRAFGRIGDRPHCVVFTTRGAVMHLISFRPAHEKGMRRYE